jgi:hypothetical protein
MVVDLLQFSEERGSKATHASYLFGNDECVFVLLCWRCVARLSSLLAVFSHLTIYSLLLLS